MAAAFFACSPFGADPNETAPPDEDRTDDAGTKKKDAAVSRDGTTVAPPPAEAGVDATRDISPSPPSDPFADVTYEHTDDFNRTDGPGGGAFNWQLQVSGIGTAADLVSEAGCSLPSVCSGMVAAVTNDSFGSGYLASSLRPDTKVLRIDFSMQITKSNEGNGGGAQLVSIELSDDRFVLLYLDRGRLELVDQTEHGADGDDVDIAGVTFNAWGKYRFFIDLGNKKMMLARDGSMIGTKVIRDKVVTAATMGRLRLGITYVSGEQFRINYDDVGVREWKN